MRAQLPLPLPPVCPPPLHDTNVNVDIDVQAIADALATHTTQVTDTLSTCGGAQDTLPVVTHGLPLRAAHDLR